MLIELVSAKGRSISEASAVEQISWMSGRLAIATWILMAIGSATRVMNAGLACPDWPLCYGTLFPSQQMNLQVFLEWFHRLDAAVVGFGLIVMAGWSGLHRQQLPKWVPWVSLLSLSLVVFQGILGALTVTKLLRFDMVTAHLGTALILFSVLLSMTMALQPYQGLGSVGMMRWISTIATGSIYLQSILGGLVASRWAVHQCLAGSELCGYLNSHILGVVPSTLTILLLGILALRAPALHPRLRQLAGAACVTLAVQASLGLAALKLHLQIEPLTVTHQTVGALLLGILLAFTVLAWRDTSTASAS